METIKLDLIPGKKMPSLHASQYDDGRDYHIDLTENRAPYTLDGTETISLTVRKCDNTLVTMDIANTFANKSYIEFRTTEQMNACAGFNYGEIVLEENGTRIGSLNFYLQVEEAPDEGGVSQSEINNLARQVEELVDEEMGDYLLKTEAEETYATITDLETLSGVVDTKASKTYVDNVVSPKADKTYVDTELGKKADTSSLATVATSGSYNDLTDKPTIPEQVQSDWNEADNTKADYIKNKPNLANVATTGNYDDLNNKPTIPVIDDTTEVNNKVWSSKKTFDEIVNILPNGVASGSIANFNTSLALPLVSAKFDVNATQEAGTPTPQSPKAISGVSAVNVVRCGKNLLNANNIELYDINGQTRMRYAYIITKAGTYTISSNNTDSCALSVRTLAGGMYGEPLQVQNGTTKTARTLTITSGTILIFYNSTNDTEETSKALFSNCQIEKGSTASDYSSYNGSTTLINLGGTYYGGYVTQDKNGKRELVVTCAKEHISLQGKTYDTANGFDAWLIYLENRSYNAGSSTNKLCSVCNNYRYEGSSANVDHYYIAPQAVAIYLAENTFRDGEFDIVYPLETPITIELPDGEPFTALVGTNNVYADSGDVEVTYKKSIDDAIAELQALILNA